MIKTARKLKLNDNKISDLKKLFRAEVGYEGYYLDKGKLKRIELMYVWAVHVDNKVCTATFLATEVRHDRLTQD